MSVLNKTFSGFLSHPEKKVLILKGKWGVGKTFAWKQYINGQVTVEEHAISYVSLFGLKDLKEVQQQILVNSHKDELEFGVTCSPKTGQGEARGM